MRRAFAFTACCALLAGCGSGERQDVDEPSANYDVSVVTSHFPSTQSISQAATMRIAVRNDGRETVPNVAVSLDGLSDDNPSPGLADPQQPVWIVEREPANGSTAYVFTWALGPLRAGETKEFTWRLSPAQTGTHTVTWTVAAGLNGKAKARTADGERPSGTFTVRVSGVPKPATVDPDSGAVVRQ